ncbi:unnamed protein product [Cuscuta campestris]|uniref:Uncharacterized protein n=1 Tax=Cuscuta campestris TaxID=132261 RepID=A0A484KRF7_9ASTE|nr:unnamed protein product [Cuscuta campestris]
MLWDKHCIPLFGKQAESFLKDIGDDIKIPKVFSSIDQPLLFEIEVKKSASSFYEKDLTVHQIITDKRIVARFTFDISTTQDSVKSKPLQPIVEPIDDVSSCKGSIKDDDLKNHETDICSITPDIKMKKDLNKEFEDMDAHLKKRNQKWV